MPGKRRDAGDRGRRPLLKTGSAESRRLDLRLEHLQEVYEKSFKPRGDLGERGEFPLGEVACGELLHVVDRPYTKRLTRVQVLVEFDDEHPGPCELREGVCINFDHGRVRTGYLPIAHLDDLRRLPRVRRVVPSVRIFPRMDRATTAIGLPGLEAQRARATSRVILGFIDTGIDASHPAFRGRILRLWDQTVHGDGIPGAGYGVEYRLAAEMEQSRDEQGHGTHIASIASRINPEAMLVVVKCGLTEGEVVDGIRYVRQVARERGLPATVTLSLGGHSGPHDGTGVFSSAIDELSGPGCIICAAAGNEGAQSIHARRVMAPRQEVSIAFELLGAGGESAPEAHLYGWADVRHGGAVEVALEAPGSDEPPTPFHESSSSSSLVYRNTLEASYTKISMFPIEADGDQRFIVDIVPTFGNVVYTGPWALKLRNASDEPTEIHIWSGEHRGGPAASLAGSLDARMKVGEPGDARQAITVGAWTTRLRWRSTSGEEERDGTLGDVPAFSSPGPLRRGPGRKPDIVAPGEWVVAARSRDASVTPGLAVGRRNVAFRGTSQATAFASGWVSLLLAENPTLTPDEVRDRLRATSERPGEADPDLWGEGRLRTT